MTALLTDNLPLLAGAPNGIKKLRELILELAVRGKLVPQDPGDEPACELLKRIAEAKARLVAEGKIKRIKQESEPSGENESFDGLPCGWSKIAGQEIFIPRSGNSKLIKGKLFDAPAADRYPGYSASGQDVWLKSWEHDGTAIIISAVGARCGKAFLASGKWSAIANTHIVWPLPLINEHYAMLILNNESYWIRSGGAQPFIKVGDTLLKKIALPPLAEQHRIVAKVDQLMALCDRLEAQQAGAESAHAQLVQALLDSLTQARDAGDFKQSWQRLAEHFNTLFTTESSIDALKQTLLQLAVMGKLVPQDPSDEPASELLRRVWEINDKLERKFSSEVGADGVQGGVDASLPNGWCVCKVSNIAEVKLGSTPSRTESTYWGGDIPWVSSGEVAGNIIKSTRERITLEGHKNSSTSMIPAGSVLIAMIGQGKTRGQSALLDIEACTNQNVAALIFNTGFVASRYVWLWAQAMYSLHRAGGHGGAQPALNAKKVKAFSFPLPPTAEQHRIVTKVDQLMALCDQLKARLNQARQVHEQLACALVEQAVA